MISWYMLMHNWIIDIVVMLIQCKLSLWLPLGKHIKIIACNLFLWFSALNNYWTKNNNGQIWWEYFFNANETLEMKIEFFSYAHCKIKLPNKDIDLMFFCTFVHLVFGINPLLSMIRWPYPNVVFSQTHTALKKVAQCFFCSFHLLSSILLHIPSNLNAFCFGSFV